MHGNVSEWCEDSCYYKNGVVTDTYRDGIVDPLYSKGSNRVYRGGSWYFFLASCRSANRECGAPGAYASDGGFRLVMSGN